MIKNIKELVQKTKQTFLYTNKVKKIGTILDTYYKKSYKCLDAL